MKQLLGQIPIVINGRRRVLGTCCMCGRKLSASHLNKTGARCYHEGAQYDDEGKLLYSARTEKTYKAIQKLKRTFDLDSNDAEHDAAVALLDAIEEEGLLP